MSSFRYLSPCLSNRAHFVVVEIDNRNGGGVIDVTPKGWKGELKQYSTGIVSYKATSFYFVRVYKLEDI